MLPHPFSHSLSELVAQRFRVLGDPTRIRLLNRLREGEASVQDLTDTLATSQQNVSKHLGVLAQAGIVERRKDGNLSLYRIADDSVFELCERVCGSLQRRVDELSAVVSGSDL